MTAVLKQFWELVQQVTKAKGLGTSSSRYGLKTICSILLLFNWKKRLISISRVLEAPGPLHWNRFKFIETRPISELLTLRTFIQMSFEWKRYDICHFECGTMLKWHGAWFPWYLARKGWARPFASNVGLEDIPTVLNFCQNWFKGFIFQPSSMQMAICQKAEGSRRNLEYSAIGFRRTQ